MVLTLGGEEASGGARFSSAERDGAKYLMVRYRPELPAQPQRQRRDWVFLFESSGDRDPLLARAQVEVIRGLLQNAEADDTFAVLAANTRARSPMEELLPVTGKNVSDALRYLEESHPIGALDLEAALSEAERLLRKGRDPYLVHVGSGIAAMGEQRTEALVRRVPEKARYVGVGVGRRWNRDLMKAAAERTGGTFTPVNPDEPISWRAFELASTLNTPRLLDVAVSDDGAKNRWLTFSGLAAHGEEVCAVTRLAGELPGEVRVRGRLDDRPFEVALPVRPESRPRLLPPLPSCRSAWTFPPRRSPRRRASRWARPRPSTTRCPRWTTPNPGNGWARFSSSVTRQPGPWDSACRRQPTKRSSRSMGSLTPNVSPRRCSRRFPP